MTNRRKFWQSGLHSGIFGSFLFLACGSSDQGRNKPSESVAQTTNALAGSTTLAQALTGKIVPITGAPGNLISASTAGEPSVGHDGSASYVIPIWVPNGINGLKPSLSVEYNSEAGVGLLGPRWRLTGLSVITHCPKVRAIDAAQSAVDLSGDVFCLDGERLLRQPGSDDFRPERDTYAKVVGTKDAGGFFVSFKAYQQNGLIYHYGRTPSSRLHGNPRAFPPRATSDVTYAYYLDKIEDRYSNSIQIRYQGGMGANPGPMVTELVPDTISWGSTGDADGLRSVSFSYEDLPTPQKRYVSGLGIESRKYLKTLTIKGPNGVGGTPVLKTYGFTYDTKSSPNGPALVTGDRVLSSISECDANGVCKKPTSIQWEPGSLTFTRKPFTGTNDAFVSGYGSPDWNGDYSNSYTRVLAEDINGDGRDDIIYRNWNGPHHQGSWDCMGWRTRLATVALNDDSGIPTLGSASDLRGVIAGSWSVALGVNQDQSCNQLNSPEPGYWEPRAWAAGQAYPGDLILTDIDGDGLTDFLVPLGKGVPPQTPWFGSYRVFLNKGTNPDPVPINFLDSIGEWAPEARNTWPVRSAMVAVGDIDGDGITDIIRPTENPPLHLAAASVASPGALTQRTGGWQGFPMSYRECTDASKCNKAIPDMPWENGTTSIRDVATVDLDGDGTVEVIRNSPNCYPLPSDPGMCSGFDGVASVRSPTMNGMMRMVPSTGGTSGTARWFADINGDGLTDLVWVDPAMTSRIWTNINSGQGFVGFTSMDLPAGARITGVGAKDGGVRIVDFNQDGRQDLLLVVSDSTTTMPVLLSKGDGTFTVHSSGVSPGWSFPYATQTLVADMNADGLPDIVNLEGGGLVGYIRQGRAPLMVTSITEGTGRNILVSYDIALDRPTSGASFYASSPSITCNEDKKRLECLKRGRWLTKSLTIGGADVPLPVTQTFSYRGGVSDKHGRGFLGFTKRWIVGPGSRVTEITYDPTARIISSPRYVYPYAFLPKTVRVDVDTWQGSFQHQYSIETNTYSASFRADKVYGVYLSQQVRDRGHCPSSIGRVCTGPGQGLSSEVETFVLDNFGNLTSHGTTYKRGDGTVLQTDSETTYFAPNSASWLVTLHDSSRNATRTSTAGSVTKTRTLKITPDSLHGGIASIYVEPNGDDTTRLERSYWRDDRGRLTNILDIDIASGTYRWTESYSYEDADGIDVASSYNALNYRTRYFRHPGLGLLVEVVDPNGLAATRSYDTFGRPLNETKISGAYVNTTYLDGPGTGAVIRVAPSGLNYRTIHLDSHGREAKSVVGVDANRALTVSNTFDALGRVGTRSIRSGPEANPTTTLDLITLTYDDLNRLQSECHLSSEGQNVCKTNLYEGTNITSTDEAGRVVRYSLDAMGRPYQHLATVRGVGTVATFQYGPFGTLTQESTSDGSGQTDFGYDILGRQTSVSRKGAGIRGVRYNAFGDVVESYKQRSDLTKVDRVDYWRDLLGRVTYMFGSGIDTAFYWDAPIDNPGVPAPYAIGKLVDAFTDSPYTSVRYEYGSNGLLKKKTWWGTTFSAWELGAAQFDYDSIGRLTTLTYPTQLGADPLKVRYGYFGFNGAVSSLTNAANNDVIWAAQAWNDRGQFTSEAMDMAGGPTITKSTAFDPATGLPEVMDMAGTNGFASYRFDYDAGGLPKTFRSAGSVSGTWTSSLVYDNLGRLESWVPATSAPTVSFTYDSDGNLTKRAWSGETVNYGTTTSARTVAVVQGGVTVRNDSYQFDQWGRIFDTPAVSLTYNAFDSVTSVTEKATGRQDYFSVDPFGKKLYQAFGNPYDGPPYFERWTLDDIYEFRRDASGTEERCRLRANGRLVADVIRTTVNGPRTATYYLTDPVGSVLTEGSSSSGALTARARRDPFGNALSSASSPYLPTDPSAANPDGSSRMAYGGHPREAGFGLVDMDARYYSPRLGRFISPDSVIARPFERRDYNPFAYAWNNPMANTDPDGRSVVAVLYFLSEFATPNYTSTDPNSLPHSLQNPSAGYDTGQGSGVLYGPSSSCPGCVYQGSVLQPKQPPPRPPPVVRMPDNVATASLTTDNGGMLFGSNFRFKTDTGSSGSESPISPFKIANNILDGFDVGFDWVLKPLLIKNVIIDGQTAFRYLSVGGKVFNESYDLFKFFDKAGLAASNINNRVVGPFITGYHAAEMVDMIRQGRQDDAFTAASHMVGPWVFGWDFVTENYDPPQRHNFGGSSRFENSSISSPWQRSEFSSQSLMRELGGNQVSGDYLPPGT